MNILEAKQEIKRTFRAYSRKNADGSPRIPIEQQRPILMIGPPGIGKTAIMRQIAKETGCGLLCYSMTHHTRQSAIGLPYIEKRVYGGQSRSVTEYTMSEIVASVYDYIERTGIGTGILFLDEINCVSETLAPVMLQLLQNKTFGVHPLPEGWMIVAAGNPPEYNKSVREMDMATMDRVKHLEIAADLPVWRQYAADRDIHPAITGYLSLYPEHFYRIDATPRGRLFVTARGWEDMSLALLAYEEDGEEVTEEWFLQYLQHDEVAHGFAIYYRLFRSLGAGMGELDETLLGDARLLKRLSASECLTVASLLFHPIEAQARALGEQQKRLKRLKEYAAILADRDISAFIREKREALKVKDGHRLLDPAERLLETEVLDRLEALRIASLGAREEPDSIGYICTALEKDIEALEREAATLSEAVSRAYAVLEACPEGEGSLLFLTSDISADATLKEIVKAHPVDAYARCCLKLI